MAHHTVAIPDEICTLVALGQLEEYLRVLARFYASAAHDPAALGFSPSNAVENVPLNSERKARDLVAIKELGYAQQERTDGYDVSRFGVNVAEAWNHPFGEGFGKHLMAHQLRQLPHFFGSCDHPFISRYDRNGSAGKASHLQSDFVAPVRPGIHNCVETRLISQGQSKLLEAC